MTPLRFAAGLWPSGIRNPSRVGDRDLDSAEPRHRNNRSERDESGWIRRTSVRCGSQRLERARVCHRAAHRSNRWGTVRVRSRSRRERSGFVECGRRAGRADDRRRYRGGPLDAHVRPSGRTGRCPSCHRGRKRSVRRSGVHDHRHRFRRSCRDHLGATRARLRRRSASLRCGSRRRPHH